MSPICCNGRDFVGIVAAVLVGSLISPAIGLETGVGTERKTNILFIAVDDLRPELKCYGQEQIISPNIDRLAQRGLVFERAYCQQAICMASRSSLLSGCRADTARIYTNRPTRKLLPNTVFLPQYFKNNGYHTEGLGKIYHNNHDDALSWSVPHWLPEHYKDSYVTKAGRKLLQRMRDEARSAGKKDPFQGKRIVRGMPWEIFDGPEDELPDAEIAGRAIEVLNEVKGKPFFLGVGFLRPHLPFVAPRKYWDMYEPGDIKLADNPFAPKDVPDIAMSQSSELRGQYRGVPQSGPIPDELSRRLIHGYYACVSFVDVQIGRVLNELNRLGLGGNTIIVLWGDHGWHLGDHGLWCKHTNFENATRSLLIVSVPGMKAAGAKTKALVEFVDIYPTLCELAGLPLPGHLEGTSFVPLLDNPRRQWKKAAFSHYPRGGYKVLGCSMRTDRYRYTEWRRLEDNQIVDVELYDYKSDPDENVNIAGRPGNAELEKRLARMHKAGWQDAGARN
ncbi:MAG: sulfatase [Planctomycetota bacterium]|jgi:arylsulfatase A-like enzyme